MFIHFHQLNKPLLVVLFIFSIPLGLWFLFQGIFGCRALSGPHAEGTVLSVQECYRFAGIPAARVIIKIENSNELVTAMIARAEVNRLGPKVGLHHVGTTPRDVVLDIQDPPSLAFWLALISFVVPFLLLALYVKFKGKPGYEMVIR